MRKLLLLWIVFGVVFIGEQAVAQLLDSSTLPILIIDTRGQAIPNEPKIVASLKIIDNGPGKTNFPTDKPSFESTIGIEQRGSSSRILFPKKPYGFELRDAKGEEGVSAPLLGMPAEEDWVLNATYNDKTLVREVLTYGLYRQFSSHYATPTRYCEVILNDQYQGLYILMEKIKRDKNRINISNLKSSDTSGDALTGGYILKLDKTEGSASRTWESPFKSSSNKSIPIQIEFPKIEDITEAQFNYIKEYLTSFETALKSEGYRDEATGYPKYINVDSWVDYLIINEVCRNVDAYRISTFFYKDRESKGGKLVMGPIWDFNLAYGNVDFCQGESYMGWAFDFNNVCQNEPNQMPFWWNRLLMDFNFARKVRLRYQSLREDVLKTDRVHQYIDSTITSLDEAPIRNFQRWPVIGQKLWPNYYVGNTYQDEVKYLKDWISLRLKWMDQALLPFRSDVTGSLSASNNEALLLLSPNPALHKQVQIQFNLPTVSAVRLLTIDLWGRATLQKDLGRLAPGLHHSQLQLESTNAQPIQLVVLEADGRIISTKKLLQP
ncbi:CotH kinase family protein [Telluribacter humicola]|uniref:CotH kinase family protein n=1 Tax=Telluribacter humicola TaxID=1720261 RepID=UPI001A964F0C|nr:CotH kinase family protein [Telluribacter humicola]